MPKRITNAEWARIWAYIRQHRTDNLTEKGEANATKMGRDAIAHFDLVTEEDQAHVWQIADELATNYNRRLQEKP